MRSVELQQTHVSRAIDEKWRHDQLVRTYIMMGREDKALDHYDNLFASHHNVGIYKSYNFPEQQQQAISRGVQIIYINTIPKSASEFIATKLAEGLGVPRIRVRARYIKGTPIPSHFDMFLKGGAICKEHANIGSPLMNLLQQHQLTKFIFHVRDPRAVAVSSMRGVEKSLQIGGANQVYRESHHRWLVEKGRVPADFKNWSSEQRANYEVEEHLPKIIRKIHMWYRIYQEKNSPFILHFTQYEKFHANPVNFFEEILDFYNLDASKFNFKEVVSSPNIGSLNFREEIDGWRNAQLKINLAWPGRKFLVIWPNSLDGKNRRSDNRRRNENCCSYRSC